MTAKMPGRYPDARRGEDGQLRIGGGQLRVEVTTKRVGGGQLRIPEPCARQEQRQRYIDHMNDPRPRVIRVRSAHELDGPIEPDDDLWDPSDLNGDLFEPIDLDDDA